MKARVLLLAIAALLAAAAAWWLAVFAPREPFPEQTGTHDRASLARANGDARGPDSGAATIGARTAGDAPAEVPGIRVYVVDARGDPVPGATVRYWQRRSDEQRKKDSAWLEEHEDDLEAALTRFGAAATSAADGTVQLDTGLFDPEAGTVIARLGDLYGVGDLDTETRETLIRVQRDLELTVEVVDSRGRAQPGRRVRLELEQSSLQDGASRQSAIVDHTDGEGRVRVPHLQLVLENAADAVAQCLRARCERRTSDASVLVVAERSVPWADLATKSTLQLVVPPGGAIAVRVVDAAGQPADASVSLSDEAGDTREIDPVIVDGVRWFRGVPPRRRWTVAADAESDPDAPLVTAAVNGPAGDDDVVAVDLRVSSNRRWNFLLKLVRSDGVPVQRLDMRWICAELGLDVSFNQTFEEGRPRLWSRFPAAVANVHHFELHVESPHVAPQVLRFDGTFTPGDNELGTLVLTPPATERVLASLDVRGEGASLNATAKVLLRAAADEMEVMLRRKDDRIDVLGTPTGVPMSMSCGCDGWLWSASSIGLGEHRVVNLTRAAGLVVPFVAPELPVGELTAELHCLDRDEENEAELVSSGRVFRWSWLAPGRYRLRIHGAGRLLHEEPELQLRAGMQRWPATAARLDLRGRVSACRVIAHAADPDRRLLHVETLCLRPGSDLPPAFDHRLPENWFLPTPEPFDVLVRAWRFVPQRVHDPRSDVAIDLQPLTKVEILAGNAKATIHVHIREDGVRDPVLRAFDTCNEHAPDTDHESSASLMFAPGTVLEAWIVRKDRPASRETIVVGTSPLEVVLR